MSALDREAQRALACDVFAALGGEPPAAVRMLSRALGLADGPLAQFGVAFDFWADALEIPDSDGALAVLKMSYDLRRVACFDPAAPALMERLEAADGLVWQRLGHALREIWTAHEFQKLDLIHNIETVKEK